MTTNGGEPLIIVSGLLYLSCMSTIHASKMIDLLPVELIVVIISLLPTVRDRIKLRCISRRLRSVGETPSLWRDFKWPCYEDRDREESCIQSVLKSCGEHIQLLSFPDQVPPSKLIKLLDHCRNTAIHQLYNSSLSIFISL